MCKSIPAWIRPTLVAAAVFNLMWGIWVVLRPGDLFAWFGVAQPNYVQIWQGFGLLVGLYGIGYAIAASDPFRHWPIILVGLLGKILGPLGFFLSYWNENLPHSFFWLVLVNDLIWLPAFGTILYLAFRENSAPPSASDSACPAEDRDPRFEMESQLGQTIYQISQRKPLMLVFLRHGGCTFCRQTLSDLQHHRDEILDLGVEVAIVHMGSPMEGTMMLSNYELDFFHRFSDPQCKLYRRYGFQRGKFSQLFTPKILWRGMKACLLGGHGIGKPQGDGFQLPGVVVVYQQESILAFPAEDASERFDYLEIAQRAHAIVVVLSPPVPLSRLPILN
jgi:peroxiredoxin